jgi:hypothetical protein
MATTPSVGTILYEKPLTKIDWSPFARTARLLFGYGDGDTTISLYGIHLFATRQTTLGPVEDSVGIDCIVRLAEVHEHSAFLDRFLGGALGFDSVEYLYDLAGHPQATPDFVQPRHLTIVCDSGQLDVIFERITIETFGGQEPTDTSTGETQL